MRRMSKFLRTLPDPKPCPKGEWAIDDQYIIDHTGQAIVQWGSYTTKRNADLIVLAKRYEKFLREMDAGEK